MRKRRERKNKNGNPLVQNLNYYQKNKRFTNLYYKIKNNNRKFVENHEVYGTKSQKIELIVQYKRNNIYKFGLIMRKRRERKNNNGNPLVQNLNYYQKRQQIC